MTTTYLERLLDPWREFDRMSRLLSNAPGQATEYPAVNVWVNGEDAVITSEIPGVTTDDIDISVTGNAVTLRGKRTAEEEKDVESYHRHELWHGNFSKTVQLPFNVDSEKVHASYKNGILHVELPKLEAEKPKKIKIEL
jgi:HSP20 family protein